MNKKISTICITNGKFSGNKDIEIGEDTVGQYIAIAKNKRSPKRRKQNRKGPNEQRKLLKKKRKSRRKKEKKSIEFIGSYTEYIASSVWRIKRKSILSRDNFKCTICHDMANSVHHWWYTYPYGNESDFQLTSLCFRCHSLAHGEYEDDTQEIQNAKPKKRYRLIRELIKTIQAHIDIDIMNNEYTNIVLEG